MRHLRWFALSAVLFSAFGCSPSPEKVCKNFEALESKSDKKSKKDKDSDKEKEKCVKDMAKFKEKSPEGFTCIAKCSELSDYDGAMGCTLGCIMKDDKLKKEMGGGGDDDDKDKKKKSDDDDDDKGKKKKKSDD